MEVGHQIIAVGDTVPILSHQSIWPDRFGETGHLFAPKRTGLYRTPSMPTGAQAVTRYTQEELAGPYTPDPKPSNPRH